LLLFGKLYRVEIRDHRKAPQNQEKRRLGGGRSTGCFQKKGGKEKATLKERALVRALLSGVDVGGNIPQKRKLFRG